MANLSFVHPAWQTAGDPYPTISAAGSGTYDTIGAYGNGGFGYSVPVNEYQYNVYVTNDDGTSEYPGGAASGALPNLRYQDATHAYVANESSGTLLQSVATGEATLKVIADDFGSSVATQNATFQASARTGANDDPTDITVQTFEIKAGAASGDSSWTNTHGSTSLSLADQVAASSHDFYIGISVSPTSLGSKEIQYVASLEAV